ncbi:large ATP-binding protein [Streptomyces koyangensis]
MNPYDASTRPGSHLVAETLAIPDVSTLSAPHPPGAPLEQAATRAMEAAQELDAWHAHVTDEAQEALSLLEPLGRGELGGARVSYALLRSAVPKLGDLLAQQDRAYDQLLKSLSAYQRLLPRAGAAEPSAAVTPDKSQLAPTLRSTSPPEPQPSRIQLSALEEIRRGRVRLKERVVRSGIRVATEPGSRRIALSTFLAMQEAGWVDCDTSATLHFGQRISLTERGEEAFRAACATELRLTAALHRGARDTSPPPPATSPPPLPGTKPRRSR